MHKFIKNYFLFLIFFLSIFVSGIIDSQDGLQYLAIARNIYHKGEPTAPEYGFRGGTNIHMSTYVGEDGKTYSPTGLGFSLAMLPSVAISDVIYQYYDIAPPDNFPLANNWPTLFFASFTNIFFGAGIVVILYLYLRELKLSHKQALLISFLGFIFTNLFSLSKHILAHSMFIFFIFLSFYLVKLFSRKQDIKYLILSGSSYGIAALTYNQTFLLPLIPFLIYFLLLSKKNKKKLLKILLIIMVSALPFILINKGFESIKSKDYTSIVYYSHYAKIRIFNLPIGILIEGLWGQIFSPGRSIFIYSPTLVVPFLLWHRLRKKFLPEIIATALLTIIYILFYAIQYSTDKQGVFTGLWHGELSWGPRYLSPIIPFGIILVGLVYKKMKNIEKYLLLAPLLLIGIYVNILGTFMPNQIKLHEMEPDFKINGTYYTNFTYINLLPRYSPILNMSKKLTRLPISTYRTLQTGDFNAEFYDGIDFAFNVGPERWRVIEETGYIRFDNPEVKKINNIEFAIINHKMDETATYSATLSFNMNGQLLANKYYLDPGETQFIDLPIESGALKMKGNELIINADYDQAVTSKSPQFIAIKKMAINGNNINLESIDVPYISNLGRAMGYEYNNWGGENKDLWKTWHIHTQVYERTPDFWWLRPLYYWDVPNKPFIFLFIINISGVLYFGYKLFGSLKNGK